MAIEMIDGWNLSLIFITHETKTSTVTIGSHNNKVVFNVISSPTKLVIIGLSWPILHNLQVDWKMMNFHFELVNKTAPKYEAFPTSTLDSEHDNAHEPVNACKNSSGKEILGVTKDLNISNLYSCEQEHSYKQQRRICILYICHSNL